jgi:hypothetical protein
VNRAQIPDALMKARRADIDRIPTPVLAKLTRADLVNRLLAAGEYRRRAAVPHLDSDLFWLRHGQASEVLTTSDLRRADELVKGAGVGVTTGAVRSPAPQRPYGRVVKSSGPAPTTYPAVDALVAKATAERSVAAALEHLAKTGRLADLERDIAAMRRDIAAGRALTRIPATELAKGAAVGGYAVSELAGPRSAARQAMAKAAEYQEKAMVVTDPEMRRDYLALAAQERGKAGTR